jgi:hypothetical protein
MIDKIVNGLKFHSWRVGRKVQKARRRPL